MEIEVVITKFTNSISLSYNDKIMSTYNEQVVTLGDGNEGKW